MFVLKAEKLVRFSAPSCDWES